MSTDAHPALRTAAEPPAPTSRGSKDDYFSNAKVALIVLVVIGHSWSPLIEKNDSANAFYLTLYELHMPAFILICGYLSKSFASRPGQWQRLITGAAVPYFVFSILYGLLGIWISEDGFSPNLLNPYYLLWFLVTLFVWRATAPMWKVVRFPIAVAVLISLGAATMDLSSVFEAGRLLQYLPFFVAGLCLDRAHFEKLRRPLVRVAGTVLSLGIGVMAYMYGRTLDVEWFYYSKGGKQLDVSIPEALAIRGLLLVCAAVLIVTFFSFVPDRTLPISRFGALTMYPFLLHGFVTKGVEHGLKFYDQPFPHTAIGTVTVTVAAVLLACLLMTKPVRWLTKPIVEPPVEWALRTPDQPAGSAARSPDLSR